MATILVVEDDPNTQLLLVSRLKKEYGVLACQNGEEALEILYRSKVDLIVSDIMMPKMDGYELLKTLRAEAFSIPILLLTAKHELNDKRLGFSLGTDDYLTKPINYEELIWRIQALLRRSKITSDNQIVLTHTVIDSQTLKVTHNHEEIDFSKKEFNLIFKLLSYPNIVFTKTQLLDDIWGYDSNSGEDTIKTHISKIRNKLKQIDDFEIVTVKGLGYKAVIINGDQ
ncbi:response regulator transcription factor [Marinilactibacillus sp. Marseille-P9653]|uniref:response regulator transcription factor n=1 Tax=Marinilactibacillus sp. Marseille-P9653 TaxID=2866583 RepID=UPI001CE3D404|nr:response regulator transcription factor [Marinilactibacillus sp. Marseille-P9653]